jgi:hypothetical protein
MLDWDLEAPGLHRYFTPFFPRSCDLSKTDGVIDFLINFTEEALGVGENQPPDKNWYLPYANILPFVVPLRWPFPAVEGKQGLLHLVPAGRQDASYSVRVTNFNWSNFYDRLGGGAFLAGASDKMRAEYDYVLIDSRTGVSDSSGICTVQLPDVLAVVSRSTIRVFKEPRACRPPSCRRGQRGRSRSTRSPCAWRMPSTRSVTCAYAARAMSFPVFWTRRLIVAHTGKTPRYTITLSTRMKRSWQRSATAPKHPVCSSV